MLQKVRSVVRRFAANEDGLETVEYAVIAGMVVVGVAVTVVAVRQILITRFEAIEQAIIDSGG